MLPRYRTGERRDSLHGLLLVLVVLQVQLHHDFLHPRTKNVRKPNGYTLLFCDEQSSAQQRPDRQARKSKSREKQNESSLGSKARSVPLERRPALRTRTGTAGRKKPDRDQCEQRGSGRGLPSTSRRWRTRTRGGSAAGEDVRGWGVQRRERWRREAAPGGELKKQAWVVAVGCVTFQKQKGK